MTQSNRVQEAPPLGAPVAVSPPPPRWRVPLARAVPAAALLLACGAYLIGLRVLFAPVLIAVSALVCPVPSIMRSALGRLVMGILYAAGLLQIASSIQFLILPSSGFRVAAAITTLLALTLLLIFRPPSRGSLRTRVVTTTDIGALVVIALFVLPFAVAMARQGPVRQIAEWGSLQIVDAVNQFLLIADQMRNQHFPFGTGPTGYNLPFGFYTMAAFVERSFYETRAALGWHGAVLLYFGQYLVVMAGLAYAAVALCQAWLAHFTARTLPPPLARGVALIAALAVGLPLVVFFLMVMVSEGFLAYAYVGATVISAILCLLEFGHSAPWSESDHDARRRGYGYCLAAALLLFGMASTWPLLVPALGLTVLLCFMPIRERLRPLASAPLRATAMAIVLALALLLLPVYFQLRYGGISSQINLGGALSSFPYLAVVAVIVVSLIIVASTATPSWLARLTALVILPMVILVGATALEQEFVLGKLSYYPTKTALLLDLLGLCIGTAALLAWQLRRDAGMSRLLLLVPVPATAVLLLMAPLGDPLHDVRAIFPEAAGVTTSGYLTDDITLFMDLGRKGALKHFDAISMHYQAGQKTFSSDLELSFWADTIAYEATDYDREANACFMRAYDLWSLGALSLLPDQVRQCAQLAAHHGDTYYVVTDKGSAPYVARTFAGLVHIVD